MFQTFRNSLLIGLAVFAINSPVLAQDTLMAPQAQETAVQQSVPQSPSKKPNAIAAFFNKFYTNLVGGGAEPDPSGTMVAPFEPDTRPLAKDAKGAAGPLPVNSATLDQPHRSAADLAQWLQQVMAESLSFSAASYPNHVKQLERGFTPAAINEFNAWATATGVINALEVNQMQLNGFVSDLPFLLNEGVVAGRYRWLYEIPVMVSFVPLGTTGYVAEQGTDSRRLIITLQIGRVAQSSMPDQVMVESWSVKDNTRRN